VLVPVENEHSPYQFELFIARSKAGVLDFFWDEERLCPEEKSSDILPKATPWAIEFMEVASRG
jgi:hypothetical protein